MNWIATILLILMLGACAAPEPVRVQPGAEVNGPYGWYEYCIRHPEDRDCKP